MSSKMKMFVDSNKNSFLQFFDTQSFLYKYALKQNNDDSSFNIVENSGSSVNEIIKFQNNGSLKFLTYVEFDAGTNISSGEGGSANQISTQLGVFGLTNSIEILSYEVIGSANPYTYKFTTGERQDQTNIFPVNSKIIITNVHNTLNQSISNFNTYYTIVDSDINYFSIELSSAITDLDFINYSSYAGNLVVFSPNAGLQLNYLKNGTEVVLTQMGFQNDTQNTFYINNLTGDISIGNDLENNKVLIGSGGSKTVDIGSSTATVNIQSGGGKLLLDADQQEIELNSGLLDINSSSLDLTSTNTLAINGGVSGTITAPTLTLDGTTVLNLDGATINVNPTSALNIDCPTTTIYGTNLVVNTTNTDINSANIDIGSGTSTVSINSGGGDLNINAGSNDINITAGAINHNIDNLNQTAVNMVLTGTTSLKTVSPDNQVLGSSITVGSDTSTVLIKSKGGNMSLDATGQIINMSSSNTNINPTTELSLTAPTISATASSALSIFSQGTSVLSAPDNKIQGTAIELGSNTSTVSIISGGGNLDLNASTNNVNITANELGLTLSAFSPTADNITLTGTTSITTTGATNNVTGTTINVGSNTSTVGLTSGGGDLTLSASTNKIINSASIIELSGSQVDVGLSSGSSTLNLYSKGGNLTIDYTGQTCDIDGGAFNLASTGQIDLESTAGHINMGANSDNQNINIGTGGVRNITIGNTNTGTALTLQADTLNNSYNSYSLNTTGSLALLAGNGLSINATTGNLEIGSTLTSSQEIKFGKNTDSVYSSYIQGLVAAATTTTTLDFDWSGNFALSTVDNTTNFTFISSGSSYTPATNDYAVFVVGVVGLGLFFSYNQIANSPDNPQSQYSFTNAFSSTIASTSLPQIKVLQSTNTSPNSSVIYFYENTSLEEGTGVIPQYYFPLNIKETQIDISTNTINIGDDGETVNIDGTVLINGSPAVSNATLTEAMNNYNLTTAQIADIADSYDPISVYALDNSEISSSTTEFGGVTLGSGITVASLYNLVPVMLEKTNSNFQMTFVIADLFRFSYQQYNDSGLQPILTTSPFSLSEFFIKSSQSPNITGDGNFVLTYRTMTYLKDQTASGLDIGTCILFANYESNGFANDWFELTGGDNTVLYDYTNYIQPGFTMDSRMNEYNFTILFTVKEGNNFNDFRAFAFLPGLYQAVNKARGVQSIDTYLANYSTQLLINKDPYESSTVAYTYRDTQRFSGYQYPLTYINTGVAISNGLGNISDYSSLKNDSSNPNPSFNYFFKLTLTNHIAEGTTNPEISSFTITQPVVVASGTDNLAPSVDITIDLLKTYCAESQYFRLYTIYNNNVYFLIYTGTNDNFRITAYTNLSDSYTTTENFVNGNTLTFYFTSLTCIYFTDPSNPSEQNPSLPDDQVANNTITVRNPSTRPNYPIYPPDNDYLLIPAYPYQMVNVSNGTNVGIFYYSPSSSTWLNIDKFANNLLLQSFLFNERNNIFFPVSYSYIGSLATSNFFEDDPISAGYMLNLYPVPSPFQNIQSDNSNIISTEITAKTDNDWKALLYQAYCHILSHLLNKSIYKSYNYVFSTMGTSPQVFMFTAFKVSNSRINYSSPLQTGYFEFNYFPNSSDNKLVYTSAISSSQSLAGITLT